MKRERTKNRKNKKTIQKSINGNKNNNDMSKFQRGFCFISIFYKLKSKRKRKNEL